MEFLIILAVAFYGVCVLHALFTGKFLWAIVMMIAAPACIFYPFAADGGKQ